MKRRKLLQATAAGTAGLLIGGPFATTLARAQDDPGIQATRIDDSLSLFSGAGANVLVHKAGNGDLLAVDGGLRANAGALLATIREHMGSDRITTLLNTHWHPEQTGLNRELGSRGVRIFAHANTRQWLSTRIERLYEDKVHHPLPEPARPSEIFYHYGALEHGGEPEALLYGYLRQAHTDGDMYAYFPDSNVLHGGGVVSNDGWPMIDWWTGGWIGGLAEGVDTLLDVCDDATVIVPANGPVMSRDELVRQRDMYATIFERVRELFYSAHSPQETIDAKPAQEFEDEMGNADEFVLQAHRSVLAHYAPDA